MHVLLQLHESLFAYLVLNGAVLTTFVQCLQSMPMRLTGLARVAGSGRWGLPATNDLLEHVCTRPLPGLSDVCPLLCRVWSRA